MARNFARMAFPNESPASREARNRAMEAMPTMRKIDIAEAGALPMR